MTEQRPALELSHAGTIGAGGVESGHGIENVSFACASGTWTALAGPEGAGKTGVLRCAAGLDPLTAGEVRLAEGLRLAHVGLVPVAERPAQTRAAEVVLALAGTPDVLLADDLTRGLAAVDAAAVLDLLRDAVDRRGLCVVASASDLASLERADTVVLLAEGRVAEIRVMP
ncbi:ABC transporter ATP-binding protein [Streptomyces sp. NPDC014870]|uniref:ATP-binding cassette domain-containing protein n=1 Tax=Streptomyces sp. NPDC014870 TaxID=3364925 RepID=UPI0036FA7842